MKNIMFLLAILIVGCSNEKTISSNNNLFFDLKGFIQSQYDVLKNSNKLATKVITIGGKQETKTLDSKAILDDLAGFKEADINRPTWIDKYKVDSLLDGANHITEMVYTSKDSSMRTKEMRIVYNHDQVIEVKILRTNNSFVADMEQLLYFTTNKGYSIQHKQKLSFNKEDTIKSIVTFNK
jgi:Jacalin-like lectin domain